MLLSGVNSRICDPNRSSTNKWRETEFVAHYGERPHASFRRRAVDPKQLPLSAGR